MLLLFATTLPFLLTAKYAVVAEDQQTTTTGRLGASLLGGEETVSSEPLTFEVPEHAPIDRWSILEYIKETSHLVGGDENVDWMNDYVIADNEVDQHRGEEEETEVSSTVPETPEEKVGYVQTVVVVGEAMKWDLGIVRRLRRVGRPIVTEKEAVRPEGPTADEFSQDVSNQVVVNTSSPNDESRKLACSNVKITFKIDKYGKETTVKLIGGGKTVLSSVNEVGAYQTKTLTGCVADGEYTLKLTDPDGLCCSQGKGYYKISVDGTEVAAGGYFVGSKSHTIKIGYNWESRMTSRDKDWLSAHNKRRRTYNFGAGYKPLRWAPSLASDAKDHAEYLAKDCKNADLTHAKNVGDGENLAKNQGHGTWGGLYPVDKIMGRWVENELTWAYPANAHYTQVVWRGSSYVGCGESVRNLGGGATCRVQVCRYTPPGNCQVRNGQWKSEAMKDQTMCGEPCVKEGCYA